MSVIMGGSGSTGSSLVKNILNRHPDIFAGGETSFFAKKLIYENWSKAKKRITKRKLSGLRNHGFHIYNGTDLSEPEYKMKTTEVQKIASSSESLLEFCENYYKPSLEDTGSKFWLEKTPANAACFRLFLDHFSKGKAIHMVRNPYDTIASLWARGYDLYYAVGIYLLNTASAINARKYKDRYCELKYEEVIKNPTQAIKGVCSFLGVDFYSDMLKSQNEKIEVSQLSSWKYDETDNIGSQSLGRFEQLPSKQKKQIIEAVSLIRISNSGKSYYGIELSSIKEICKMLQYEFHSSTKHDTLEKLQKARNQDRLQRIKRGYKTGFNYPLDLSI